MCGEPLTAVMEHYAVVTTNANQDAVAHSFPSLMKGAYLWLEITVQDEIKLGLDILILLIQIQITP